MEALQAQTLAEFEIILVDNSGRGVAQEFEGRPRVRVIANSENLGFGGAVNQGFASSEARWLCVLNDDACPRERWLESLIAAAESDPRAGMCASRIVLADSPDLLDSAGLAIYPDGSTKQRGRLAPAADYDRREEVLLPSGCAALYRREMIDQIGGFDEDFFLYCEDADLGLRGRLAGWKCVYEPEAVVVHDYSRSAGRASGLKAHLVERNRLFTVIKTFPLLLWPAVPFYSVARYFAQAVAAARGEGLAGEFRRSQGAAAMVRAVVGAHWAGLLRLPSLWRRRSKVSRGLGAGEFRRMLRRFAVSAREIASQ